MRRVRELFPDVSDEAWALVVAAVRLVGQIAAVVLVIWAAKHR